MTDSLPQIRRIRPQEAEALRELRLRALRSDPQAFLSTYDREMQLPEQHWTDLAVRAATTRQESISVCQHHGGLVGMAGLYTDRPGRGELWGVYLDIALRGKGLSKRLLEFSIGWARQSGYQELYLEVNPQLIAAVALYRSVGFLPLGPTAHCCGGVQAQAWRLDLEP
jgi:ribosomal protein S18 acetylase RimI-like enzyme